MGELDHILARLAGSLGQSSGQPVALSGGITNRNFRVTLGGEDYVIRLHGKDTGLLGIDRDGERLAAERAAALGIAPALVATLAEGLVTRFVACSAPTGEELRARVAEIAGSLRAFHESGLELPSRFSVPELLDDYARLVGERGGRLPSAYGETVAVVARIVAALPSRPPRPCHNDLLPGNLIRARADGRVLIVDWEYAGMGHPGFDLGNLSVNNGFDAGDDDRLLEAYDGERPTDRRRAELKLLRLLSDAREGAWGVIQASVSELDFDFDGYGSEHFARLLGVAGGADFEEWLATA